MKVMQSIPNPKNKVIIYSKIILEYNDYLLYISNINIIYCLINELVIAFIIIFKIIYF